MAEMPELREKMEARLDAATGRALRSFLRKYRARVQIPTGITAAPDDPVTLGQVSSWWAEEVDQHVTAEILDAYSATYREVIGGTITETSMDQAREYLSRVRDRMLTDVPEDAFNRVRVATARGLGEGWSRQRLSGRIAAELGWEKQGGYWRDELSRIDSEIDELLDSLGKPGDPVREAARRNDPRVASLQQDRSRVRSALDAEQSTWETRSNRIARTESTGATNHAANSALADEGWSHKKWLAADDARTRPSHNSADGQVVPVAEPFLVGGVSMQNPGDPSAPAGETVNCRCTITGEDQEETVLTEAEKYGVGEEASEGLTFGTPEAPTKAMQQANPLYHSSDEAKINCQKATVAYELRRRGIPVYARPGGGGLGGVDKYFAGIGGEDLSQLLRENPTLNVTRPVKNVIERRADIASQITGLYPSGARGSMSVDWKIGGNGHIFNWEISDEGKVLFMDAQTGTSYGPVSKFWGQISSASVNRLDDKTLKPEGRQVVATRKEDL